VVIRLFTVLMIDWSAALFDCVWIGLEGDGAGTFEVALGFEALFCGATLGVNWGTEEGVDLAVLDPELVGVELRNGL
jgi:hypothetical protein